LFEFSELCDGYTLSHIAVNVTTLIVRLQPLSEDHARCRDHSIAKSGKRWNNELVRNKISNIGRMKSNIDAGNRPNMFGPKKTGELGTEKNPATVNV
jgi:hypothetical protein